MTASTFLAFTALPNGFSATGMRLSVYLTANLIADHPGATLADFGGWRNWPETARLLTFRAHFRDNGGTDLGSVPLSSPQQGDLSVWSRVLGPNTPVLEGPAATATARLVAAPPAHYDVAAVREAVRELYASHIGRPSDASSYVGTLAMSTVRIQSEEVLKAPISQFGGDDRTSSAFRTFQRFHLPNEPTASVQSNSAPEFHEIVGGAAQYPAMLRRLALVFDFEMPWSEVPIGDQQLAIVPGGPAGLFSGIATNVVALWTQYRHVAPTGPVGRVFRARGRDGRADGLVDLRDPRHQFAVEDIDGGAFQAMDYVARLAGAQKSGQPGAQQTGLPPLRTKGVQVFDTQTAADVAAAEARTQAIASGSAGAAVQFPPSGAMANAPVLYQEDINRGHRVDAREVAGGPWRSLCRRVSTFSISATERFVFDEEGFVTDSLTSANPATGADQKTSQILFRWNGWNLVVPRPGGATDDAGAPVRPSGGTHFPIRDRSHAASLQRLRYGRSYRFRCRNVDLAGNGWDPADPELASLATVYDQCPVVQYLRHEPVAPPRIDRTVDKAGVTRLIIGRPEDGEGRISHLRLAAPQSNLDQVDKHGAFDAYDPRTTYSILLKTASPDRGGIGATLVDPAYGGAVVTETWPTKSQRGTALVKPGLLDVNTDTIGLHAEAGEYEVRVEGREIRAKVPPGGAMRLQVSSFVPPALRGTFETHGGTAEIGTHAYDFIAPPEPVVIIHPVEKPITAPSFGATADPEISAVEVVGRKLGDTNANFQCDGFQVDVATTARFDVLGTWDEVNDQPTGVVWPTRAHKSAKLFGSDVPLPDGHPMATQAALSRQQGAVPIAAPAPSNLITPTNSTYDFRDSKHRRVTLSATGVSRFVEFYGKSQKDRADRFLATSSPTVVSVQNTKPPKAPIVSYIVPTLDRVEPHRDGRSRTVKTDGWGLRVFLQPGDWFDSGDEERLAVLISQPPVQGQLSQIAGDPIVAAAAVVNDLTSSDFTNARSSHANLAQVDAANSNASGKSAADRVAFTYVSASTFDVGYDFQKQLIYADLVLLPRQVYRPLIRLAIARFQPNSVKGAHLSSTVLADFIQLTPERTLSVTHADHGVHLRVTGAFPKGRGGSAVRTRLVAIAQSGSFLGGHEDREWRDVGRQLFDLQGASEEMEHFVWTCALPGSTFEHGCKRRVVVEEWEVWAEPTVADPVQGRLVYSEALRL